LDDTIKSEITEEFGLEYEFIKYLFLDKNPKGDTFIKVDMIEYGFSKY
jgi:ADP-ribose pyrophosphatase YjhB (NUDIX family)